MPPRLAPAVSALARQTMKTAFDELERTVTPTDARDFRTTTLQAVRMAALEVEKRMEAKQALRNMRRLKPLLDGMEHYAKVVDIMCNGTPFLSWIWAPITLILRISSEYIEAFELLMKGYARIASNLGRFERLSSEFLTNQDFQHTLAIYYADILQFHKHAYTFIRRSGWRLLFVTSWGRFQRRFDNLLEDLKRHGELIDSEANSHNIVEAGRIRTEIRQWREESLDQVERDEEERASSHFRSVLSWLKIDESEQLSICDSIFEEGSKYPGTCSWVTGHTKIRSWLQQKPDFPVVWLQGNPGTGKSIASGQIVRFIDNGHALVLRHFCTYSHASSTKYDNIVKSLLTQLIRKNGELVAHVYQECILNKKAPTITLLEQLVGTLCASITDEPGKMRYVWIVLDGLDECEQSKQSRLLTLMNQVTSRSASEGNTVCKVLISSRPSSVINKYLRRKQVVSLSDEATQLYKSIQMYASQRLLSAIKRLRQLDLEHEDINELANDVATKAHGMFLYARLVLDYVTSNIFYSPGEIRDSIHQLPPSLTEFYQTILAQMIKGLDTRSVDRVKTILSWVSFAKRPLKKLELLSAVTFGQGDPEADRLIPPYILDICGPLMEERRDATFAFIHLSVKEFLMSAQGLISISERVAIREHATATITALLAGRRIFRENFSERLRLLQLVRGVHGLHVYATEFWVEYLLSDAALSNGPDVSSDLFVLASRLAQELSAGRIDPLPKEFTVQPADTDERLQLFQQHHLLYEQMKSALNARSRKRLEVELFKQQDSKRITDHATILDAVSQMLHSYQHAVELLLNEESHPGVSAEELENFKSQFRASAYTCRLRSCPRATLGFESDSLRREHEITHVGGYRCSVIDCQYPPFPSAKSLKNHTANAHSHNPVPKSIRRVGQLNGLIGPSYTRKNVTKQPSTGQNGSRSTALGVQAASSVPMVRFQHQYNPVDNGSVPTYRGDDKDRNVGDSNRASQSETTLLKDRNIDQRLFFSLEYALDHLFQQEDFIGIRHRLEEILEYFQSSGDVLLPKNREIIVPAELPGYIREQLLEMTQINLLGTLGQACARARKNKGEGEKTMTPFPDFVDLSGSAERKHSSSALKNPLGPVDSPHPSSDYYDQQQLTELLSHGSLEGSAPVPPHHLAPPVQVNAADLSKQTTSNADRSLQNHFARLNQAQQMLRQNPGIVSMTDNQNFPPHVLYPELYKLLPPETTTWDQQNHVHSECEECRTHQRKCDMSRPSCTSCQRKDIYCEYKQLENQTPNPQPIWQKDVPLSVRIERAREEETAAWMLLVSAEEAGYPQYTIDEAQKRHTEALKTLESLHQYQIQLMLLEQQNKKRLLKARIEQDAAPSNHAEQETPQDYRESKDIEFHQSTDQQVTTAVNADSAEGQPPSTLPPYPSHSRQQMLQLQQQQQYQQRIEVMSPPEINIDFAPPSPKASFEPLKTGPQAEPLRRPDRSRRRKRDNHSLQMSTEQEYMPNIETQPLAQIQQIIAPQAARKEATSETSSIRHAEGDYKPSPSSRMPWDEWLGQPLGPPLPDVSD